MTNAVANYVIFDKASVLKYTSGYNISNEIMQENAIEVLSKEETKFVLLAPFIKFDDATISLRSGKLYQYLLRADYEPFVYQNVLYLLKSGETPLEGSMDGTVAFAELMHKESLMYLPAVWGEADLEEKLSEVSLQADIQEVDSGNINISFDTPVKGEDIYYIGIHIKDNTSKALLKDLQSYDKLTKKNETNPEEEIEEVDLSAVPHFSISFISDVGGEKKEHYFTGYLYGDSYLIPVGSSPYFSLAEEINEIRIAIHTDTVTAEQLDISFYQGDLQ